MGITGNLKTMQLAELLQWLSQSQKTGTLVIDSGEVEKRIYFRDGRIVSSSSTDPREYLGQFLVGRGLISEEELTGAIRMQEKSGMLLGKILVSIGSIEEKEVHRLLQVKAEEAIFDVFSWPQGRFEFLDDEMPGQEMIPISLDVTGLVLEGARRVDEWSRIRQAVPSLDAVPVTLVDAPEKGEKLSEVERRVLAAIDDKSTVGEVSERAGATEFDACQALWRAVQAKAVKVIPPPWDGRSPGTARGGGGAGGAPAKGGAASGPITAQTLLAAAQPFLEAQQYEDALRHLRAARALDPYDREVKQAVEDTEAQVRVALEHAGVRPHAVPKLTRSLEELTASQLTRNEGFVLSRINGSYDIASITKISSLPELDALLAFWRLNRAGHLTFEAKG